MFVLAVSGPNLNMCYVGLTKRSPGQILKKIIYTLEATLITRFLKILIRMFVLTICRPSLNMGNVGSKTRSSGQILRKFLFTL